MQQHQALVDMLTGWVVMQQVGRIHCAAFTDDVLHAEIANKAIFWQQQKFFGVDLSSLFEASVDMYFSQVRHCMPIE
jgi:histone-arginine methyltransferase CARM1